MEKTIKKTETRFEYRGVRCEIVHWVDEKYMEYRKEHEIDFSDDAMTINGGIWNSYILVTPDVVGEDNFKKFVIRPYRSKILPNRRLFDYYKHLEKPEIVEMHGGITYYQRIYDEIGNLYGVKIGNDYNHIWNGGETLESIRGDLQGTVDKMLEQLNQVKN